MAVTHVIRQGLWFAAAWLVLCCGMDARGADRREELASGIFACAIEHPGDTYTAGRGLLVARGEDLLPWLEEKDDSTDWRQRAFAAVLRLRIEQPEQYERWRKSMSESHRDLPSQRNTSETWRGLSHEAAGVPWPVVVDMLWEGDMSDEVVLAEFYFSPKPELVPLFVREYGSLDYILRRREYVSEAIVSLGKPIAPLLRELLQENAQERDRVQVLARALGELGDAEAAGLLAARLREIPIPNDGELPWGGYVETLCRALAQTGTTEGFGAVLDWTLAVAASASSGGSSIVDDYQGLRRSLIGFDKKALPLLDARLQNDPGEGDRIVLESLIMELRGIEGPQRDLATLREQMWVNPNPDGLLAVHRAGGDDVLDRLIHLGSSGRAPLDQLARLRVLGQLKDPRAIPWLMEQVRQQHRSIPLSDFYADSAEPDAEEVAYQRFRELGYGSLSAVDSSLLAIQQIGGPEAEQALREAAAMPGYQTIAETCLLGLHEDTEALARQLTSGDRAEREAAAVVLWDRGDPACQVELLCAAARRNGRYHELGRDRAAGLPGLDDALDQLAASDDVRRRVLARSMRARQADPDRAAWCHELIGRAAQEVMMLHAGPSLGSIQSAALRILDWRAEPADGSDPLASRIGGLGPPYLRPEFTESTPPLDERDRPLLEAVCLFGGDVVDRGIAAIALGKLGHADSMEVLAASFDMGFVQGDSPVAAALAAYGDEGAELAAKIPAPEPGQTDTGRVMTSHRGAAQSLSLVGNVQGVEEVLKGLDTLLADPELDRWEYRAGIYLTAAEKYHDPRLADAVLRVIEATWREYPERVDNQVLRILGTYDNEDLVPLYVERLVDDNHEAAVEALAGQLGEGTAELLIAQLRTTEDDDLRVAIATALGELADWPEPTYPADITWTPRQMTDQERQAAVDKTRTLAYPVLVEMLEDPSAEVNRAAAEGLIDLCFTRRGSVHYTPVISEAIGPLIQWCRRSNSSFRPLTGILAEYGGPEAGKVLLEVLRTGGSVDNAIYDAVGKLKPEGALPVLVARVEAAAAKYKPHSAIVGAVGQLRNFGPAGAEEYHRLLRELESLDYRCRCSQELASLRYTPAAGDVEQLLLRTVRAGPTSEDIVDMYGRREEKYVRLCTQLLHNLAALAPQEAIDHAGQLVIDGPDVLRPMAIEWLWDRREQ